jgi:hypothetical protein
MCSCHALCRHGWGGQCLGGCGLLWLCGINREGLLLDIIEAAVGCEELEFGLGLAAVGVSRVAGRVHLESLLSVMEGGGCLGVGCGLCLAAVGVSSVGSLHLGVLMSLAVGSVGQVSIDPGRALQETKGGHEWKRLEREGNRTLGLWN